MPHLRTSSASQLLKNSSTLFKRLFLAFKITSFISFAENEEENEAKDERKEEFKEKEKEVAVSSQLGIKLKAIRK